MNTWHRIKQDVKRYEEDTGYKFRTAHRQSKSGFHHTIMPADLGLGAVEEDDSERCDGCGAKADKYYEFIGDKLCKDCAKQAAKEENERQRGRQEPE